jgi:hypothetical protein
MLLAGHLSQHHRPTVRRDQHRACPGSLDPADGVFACLLHDPPEQERRVAVPADAINRLHRLLVWRKSVTASPLTRNRPR